MRYGFVERAQSLGLLVRIGYFLIASSDTNGDDAGQKIQLKLAWLALALTDASFKLI
jgi:hypothetical protein